MSYDEKDTAALAEFRTALQHWLDESSERVSERVSEGVREGARRHLRSERSDWDCLRFVRARKNDVSKAVAMVVKWAEVSE